MKESRENIVTLVQNVVVSCKQTYTLPEISVRDNGSVATGSSRSRPCFNAEPPRSSRERQFESAAPLGYLEARQNPHSCLNYIHFRVALSRKRYPFANREEKRVLSTRHHENRHAPGLTRRVTNHVTAPAATFQPPFNTLPRPQDKLYLEKRKNCCVIESCFLQIEF